jgi:hypothetical protein
MHPNFSVAKLEKKSVRIIWVNTVFHGSNGSVLFFTIMWKRIVPSSQKFKNAVVVGIVFPLSQPFTNNNLHFSLLCSHQTKQYGVGLSFWRIAPYDMFFV